MLDLFIFRCFCQKPKWSSISPLKSFSSLDLIMTPTIQHSVICTMLLPRINLNVTCFDWLVGGWRWVWPIWPVRSIGWLIYGCFRRPSGLEEIYRRSRDPSAASSRKKKAENRPCTALWNYCQVGLQIIHMHVHERVAAHAHISQILMLDDV